MHTKPNKNDVICGRGGHSNKHPGNRLFRRLVNVNKALYQQTLSEKSSHKKLLSLSIIHAIRNQGGRFLRKQLGEWVVISSRQAYIKTSQALRETNDYSDSSSSSSQSAQSSSYTQEVEERKNDHKRVARRSVVTITAPLSPVSDELPTRNNNSTVALCCDYGDLEPIPVAINQSSIQHDAIRQGEDELETLLDVSCWMTTLLSL